MFKICEVFKTRQLSEKLKLLVQVLLRIDVNNLPKLRLKNGFYQFTNLNIFLRDCIEPFFPNKYFVITNRLNRYHKIRKK